MHGYPLAESALTDSILNSFYKVFGRFGPGLSESIYVNAMEVDLVAKGHKVMREVDVPVYFDDRRVGRQRLDMVVDDKVIVEGKAGDKVPPKFSEVDPRTPQTQPTSGRSKQKRGEFRQAENSIRVYDLDAVVARFDRGLPAMPQFQTPPPRSTSPHQSVPPSPGRASRPTTMQPRQPRRPPKSVTHDFA